MPQDRRGQLRRVVGSEAVADDIAATGAIRSPGSVAQAPLSGLHVSLASRGPMQLRPDARRRVILPHPEDTTRRLGFGSQAPSRNERVRKRRIREVDRDRVVQDPAHPGRRRRPSIGPAILVEPSGHLSKALPETARRNSDPDADRKAPLGRRNHFARVSWHLVFLIRSTLDCHARLILSSGLVVHVG